MEKDNILEREINKDNPLEGPFSPKNWHTDLPLENYKHRWNLAVRIVEEMKKNPKAKDRLLLTINYLQESLKIAKADLRKKGEGEKVATVSPQEFIIVIDEAYQSLEELKEI